MEQNKADAAHTYDPLEDFDPLREFDPMRELIAEEVTRTWVESTGGNRPTETARLSDIDQQTFLGMILTLEDMWGAQFLSQMHLLDGDTIDDFVDFAIARIVL